MIIMVNCNPVSEGGHHDVTMEITIYICRIFRSFVLREHFFLLVEKV